MCDFLFESNNRITLIIHKFVYICILYLKTIIELNLYQNFLEKNSAETFQNRLKSTKKSLKTEQNNMEKKLG